MILPVFLAAVGGYLLGAVPFGLVLTRMAGLGDLRSIGSGNIGATNVLRTGHKGLAAATLLLDSGKGAIAAAAALWLAGPDAAMIAGFAAVVGHNFPIWLGFKGGKGVATSLGVLLVTSWPVGVTACLIWLLMAALFRYSSLAALTALTLSPLAAAWFASPAEVALAAALGTLAIVRHRANISRLLAGQETRIGKKAQAPTP